MSMFKNVRGTTAWRSPSNIALVKYWGKYGEQLPRNASVSLSLTTAYTNTYVNYRPKEKGEPPISLSFLFEDKANPKFEQKIREFLASIILHFPFLEGLHLDISSQNSFPHSTGIASSASSMSALALCLCQIESNIDGGMLPHQFFEKASYIARLGSGSAARSVYPYAASWGKHESIPFSSNEYATPLELSIDKTFKTMHDSILIVSSEEKEVSSRAGHALMDNNPYAGPRYEQANKNVTEILQAMKTGDIEKWGKIVEQEALVLHALMMASSPPFILMHANTLTIIQKIQEFRKNRGIPLYFTLDAGPNVHLLYPDNVKEEVKTYIDEELLSFCDNCRVLHDRVGRGPAKIA